jgi:DnaD/phage-associated family protein
MPDERFPGFPEGRLGTTPIPDIFFRDLLPRIQDASELRATLYAFYLLARKEARYQYLTVEDFAQAPVAAGAEAALAKAVARGTLLRAEVDLPEARIAVYFANTPRGRAAVQALQAGDWQPSGNAQSPVELPGERPNLYRLYEANLGPLTPLVADALREAEAEYPPGWIDDAVRIAVENNIRKWSYVRAILEDWRERGRDDGEDRGDSEKARRRYTQGKFADFIES